MTAVIAAILAAFLAGAVALFREHRLQQRRLLVAARVTFANFSVARNGLKTSLSTDGWAPFNLLPGRDAFSEAWNEYKGDLAGHLTWGEWLFVEDAVTRYLALGALSQEGEPSQAGDVLERIVKALDGGRDALQPYCERRLSLWALVRRRLASLRRRKKTWGELSS